MPLTIEILANALAMKSREAQALRGSEGVLDTNPWEKRLVFTKDQLAFGESLGPTVNVTENGDLVLELTR